MNRDEITRKTSELSTIAPVSYTHLDVYKRQARFVAELYVAEFHVALHFVAVGPRCV